MASCGEELPANMNKKVRRGKGREERGGQPGHQALDASTDARNPGHQEALENNIKGGGSG